MQRKDSLYSIHKIKKKFYLAGVRVEIASDLNANPAVGGVSLFIYSKYEFI
jgi:hypothetical protein